MFHVHVCALTRASADQQLRLLRAAYQVVQTGQVPLGSLLQAMERVVLPLARHCSAQALGLFFVSNIADVSATLLARFTKVGLGRRNQWWRLGRFKLCWKPDFFVLLSDKRSRI